MKPFDERLTDALVATTKDLVARFNPVLGYSQSDEISLVFPSAVVDQNENGEPSNASTAEEPIRPAIAGESTAKAVSPPRARPPKSIPRPTHIYSGRIQKLASVTASYAAARLNYYLARYSWDDLNPNVADRMEAHVAHFDGRIVPTPDNTVVMECIFWRSNFDGFRNSISHVAQAHFSPKLLHKRGLKEKLEMLATEKHVDPFKIYPAKFLFGTWVKKEQYELHGMMNPKTGEPVPGPVIRSRVRTGSFNWADWSSEQRIAFTMAKHWADGPRSPLKDSLPTVIQAP